jgi:hypothetical protein
MLLLGSEDEPAVTPISRDQFGDERRRIEIRNAANSGEMGERGGGFTGDTVAESDGLLWIFEHLPE